MRKSRRWWLIAAHLRAKNSPLAFSAAFVPVVTGIVCGPIGKNGLMARWSDGCCGEGKLPETVAEEFGTLSDRRQKGIRNTLKAVLMSGIVLV